MVPVNLGALTQTYFFARRFEDAIGVQIRVREENRFQGHWLFLAASNAFLGRVAEAREAKAALLALRPDINAQVLLAEDMYFARQQEEDLFLEAFRVLKLPMCATPEQLKSIAKPKSLPGCPVPTN
jgi:hypothetical protein